MDYTQLDENKIGSNVLYEFLIYKEWEFHKEKQTKVSKQTLLKTNDAPSNIFSSVWNSFSRYPWPEEDLARAGSLLLPWQLAVSPDGKQLAILGDSFIELRHAKDEYTTVVGGGGVPKDDKPQLRKMAWSPDSNMIAVSSSDGSVRIYDHVGSLIFKIPLLTPEKLPKKLITGLEFIPARGKKGEWELLIIYASGIVECYVITSIVKCSLDHTSVLSETGISCTFFSNHYGILFLSVKPLNLLSNESKKYSPGITAWRLLNDEPYYERIFPTDDELNILQLNGKMWNIFSYFSSSDCICKIVMSPSNEYLATLNSSGVLFIWAAPSLRLQSCLDRFDFKKNKVLVPLSKTEICTHIIDVDWRKDNKLIIVWKNAAITIHDVNTTVVLSYFGPDLFYSLPRIATASTLHGFLALECETQENASPTTPTLPDDSNIFSSDRHSQADPNKTEIDDGRSYIDSIKDLFYLTLYHVTDSESYQQKRKFPKYVQRTFRLSGVKMTTPEEMLEHYLRNEDFNGAFEICQEYGLDVTKVYMWQWRISDITKESIEQYLANIDDVDWVLNECLISIPETLSGAKELMQFGLNYTSIKPILETQSTSDLSDKQTKMISTRLKLLEYAEKLSIYELIVDENSYDMIQFKKFREQSIVESAVEFARANRTDAVKLLMTHKGNEVLPFWLNILDNYPESVKPSLYQNILPECDGDGKPVKWSSLNSEKIKDWAQQEFASLVPTASSSVTELLFEKSYNFDAETLTKWYKDRAIEIEDISTLVENSVELLEIGIARNVEDLSDLLFELKMLSTLVYDLNVNICYNTFKKMDLTQKLFVFVQKPSEFCDITVKYVHPYLMHYADFTSDKWLSLYSSYMVQNSKEILGDVIEYFNYILHGNLQLIDSPITFVKVVIDCIYAYQRVDQLQKTESLIIDVINWFCALSDAIRKEDLLDKLLSLKNELLAANLLMKNGYLTPLSGIHKIRSDQEESSKFINMLIESCLENLQRFEEWKHFFQDVLLLQRHCFNLVPVHHCYRTYISHMLQSGRLDLISHAPEYLCCSKDQPEEHLNYDTSIEVIIEAAQHYFNNALHSSDENMNLAKTCLHLIKDHNPHIQEELDLLFGVKLLSDLGVPMLPLQVRQTENRMSLIDICFEKNKNLHKKPETVYKLASKLRVFSLTKKGSHCCITLRLAVEAFQKKDFKRCAEFCSDLIKYQYSDGWKVCMNLAECDEYKDICFKKKLITFSVLHSPSRMLPEVLNIRHRLDKIHTLLQLKKAINLFITEKFRPFPNISALSEQPLKTLTFCDSYTELIKELHSNWGTVIMNLFHEIVSHSFSPSCPGIHSSAHSKFCQFNDICYGKETKKLDDRLLDIMNTLLKIVSTTDISTMEEASDLFSKVLIACSIITVNKDIEFSVSCLLNLKHLKNSEEFFKFFEETTHLYIYQLYYLGLKSSSNFEENIKKNPIEVISLLFKENLSSEYKSLLDDVLRNVKTLCEVSQVISVEKGIDLNRFKVDENYKNDTILGLAMNEDKQSFSLAIELAQKNNISVRDVVISHLTTLLLHNLFNTAMERLGDDQVISALAENEKDSLDRFMSSFDILCGTNHQQLMIFFNIIKSIDANYLIFGINPKEHISLLKKIKTLPKEIDYIKLVSGKNDLISTMRPLMQEENVFLITKLIKSLPSSLKSKYNVGKFLSEWAIQEFSDKCLNTSMRYCRTNFETLHKYLSKCSDEDIKYFAERTLFTEEVALSIDSEVRKQLLSLLIDWYSANTSRDSNVLDYLKSNYELIDKIWDEDTVFSRNIMAYLFKIEKHLRHSGTKDQILPVIHDILRDKSLNKEEIVYLHKISEIEIPLKEIAEDINEYFCERSGGEKDSSLLKSHTESEDDEDNKLLKQYVGELKKCFESTESFPSIEEINTSADWENFVNVLINSVTKVKHCLALHTFLEHLSEKLGLDRGETEYKMLRKLAKLEETSELKYVLADEIISSFSISNQDCKQFLEDVKDETAKDKMFVYWICFHSNSETVLRELKAVIRNEAESFCTEFFQIPQIATNFLLPHLLGTPLYKSIITLAVEAESTVALRLCIEALENSTIKTSNIKEQITVLKLYLKRKEEELSKGIYSTSSESSTLKSFFSLFK